MYVDSDSEHHCGVFYGFTKIIFLLLLYDNACDNTLTTLQEGLERTCFDGARPAVNHLIDGHFEQLVVPQRSVAHHDGVVELAASVRTDRSLAAARDDSVVTVVMVEAEFI